MKNLLFALLLCLFICGTATAQQQWTTSSAKKWAKSLEWANGTKVKLSPSADYLEFAKQYQANKQAWSKALAFLNDPKLDTLKPGKYVIDGDNVYAMVTEAPSKEFAQSAWESHRKYIDLHYLIRGKERIGAAPVSTATVTKPYDENRDAANYNAEGKYYVAAPGEFFLFFPSDAHRPNIKVDGYDTVKKLVIKIKYIN